MLQKIRALLNAPLSLIHLVGGIGASAFAFWLTSQGHPLWVAFPVMFAALLPESLYSASLVMEWRKQGLSSTALAAKLVSTWTLMAGVCVAVLFAAWLGLKIAVLNAALSGA